MYNLGLLGWVPVWVPPNDVAVLPLLTLPGSLEYAKRTDAAGGQLAWGCSVEHLRYKTSTGLEALGLTSSGHMNSALLRGSSTRDNMPRGAPVLSGKAEQKNRDTKHRNAETQKRIAGGAC